MHMHNNSYKSVVRTKAELRTLHSNGRKDVNNGQSSFPTMLAPAVAANVGIMHVGPRYRLQHGEFVEGREIAVAILGNEEEHQKRRSRVRTNVRSTGEEVSATAVPLRANTTKTRCRPQTQRLHMCLLYLFRRQSLRNERCVC